jgi:arabinose-5-phosphate isomerase
MAVAGLKEVNIASVAEQVLLQEATAIQALVPFINADFEKAVRLIAGCSGRIVVTGVGKSAIIGQKIVATFNSTGTPAVFMHAGDAIHGDLGIIQPSDTVLCISKSGESPEIRVLLPLLRSFNIPLIALVGNISSSLARQADCVLNTTVSREACPNDLAPTASTTAQLVMGDALAVCLMELKGFSTDDFARLHPGGTLGKKLYLQVNDLSARNEKPFVMEKSPIREVIVTITSGRLGITTVLDEAKQLRGVITDGDLRRMLEKNTAFEQLQAKDIMTTSPKVIRHDALATEALQQLRENNITQLVVLNGRDYAGIIHLHDLVREGLL